jgi:hypothetical protein
MKNIARKISVPLVVLFFACIASAHEPAVEMLAAANALLSSVTAEQKAKLVFPFEAAERENWNFIPMARAGLPLKQMTVSQQDLALDLLRTGLSHAGMAKAEAVISLENVLKELEHGAARRDPTLYYVTLFGEPSATGSWGWRFEGHHLSFNFTVVEGRHVFFTPSFIGSNPAEVRDGPKQGLRVLRDEDDLGRALVQSLTDQQRTIAVFSSTAPVEIVTGNQHHVSPLQPLGIASSQLDAEQRNLLRKLLGIYIKRYRAEIADATNAEIEAAGFDKVYFAWAGGTEPGIGHYYRIQGPTFVCEFDNTQNNANHIHTAWRDFKKDFGRDPLAEHYAREHGRSAETKN